MIPVVEVWTTFMLAGMVVVVVIHTHVDQTGTPSSL